MSQVTSTILDQEQKRNSVKVPFAIIPLPKRYQRQASKFQFFDYPAILQRIFPVQRQDILNTMKPFELERLPPMFIPFSLPGNRRMPPVLRRGYPITTKTLHNLIRGEGYEEVPAPGSPSRIDALHVAQAVLQERLQWPVRWELVHGVPESCIFEICNNYKMAKAMPENLAEQLREEMLAEGPPLWHLDYYKDNWDWKEHK